MPIRRFRLILLFLVLAPTGVQAEEAPVAVSPGSARGALIGDVCPTFSWGAVSGAKSYELVVYRVEEGSKEAKPVLRQRISGSALSWTPSLDACLLRGGQYAWNVRAVGNGKESEWSPLSIFQVAAPNEAEFEEALMVVRGYLGDQRAEASKDGASVEAESASESGRASLAPSPESPGAAATQLSVDGGVVATSFTGDGSTLTDLDPTSLTAGTAGIDISGNAAMVGGVAAAALEESSEIDEDILAHKNLPSDHHTATVDTDTFVTNKDAHDHDGGDGAAVLHASLGSVGASDHHAPFSNPDGPCFNTTQRFVDCGNGTVTDTVSGLIYLKNADCFGDETWPTANQSAAGLADGSCGLTDGSRSGDWRLQTKEEWEGIVMSSCTAVPEIVGNQSPLPGCYTDLGGSWASNVASSTYWSSTTRATDTPGADVANFVVGTVGNEDKDNNNHVWPVR